MADACIAKTSGFGPFSTLLTAVFLWRPNLKKKSSFRLTYYRQMLHCYNLRCRRKIIRCDELSFILYSVRSVRGGLGLVRPTRQRARCSRRFAPDRRGTLRFVLDFSEGCGWRWYESSPTSRFHFSAERTGFGVSKFGVFGGQFPLGNLIHSRMGQMFRPCHK